VPSDRGTTSWTLLYDLLKFGESIGDINVGAKFQSFSIGAAPAVMTMRSAFPAAATLLAVGLVAAPAAEAAPLAPWIAFYHSAQRPRLVIGDRSALLRVHSGERVTFQWQILKAGRWARIAGARRSTFTVPARLQKASVRVIVTSTRNRRETNVHSNASVPLPPPSVDSRPPAVSISPLPSPYVPSSWAGPNPPSNCQQGDAPTGEGNESSVIELDYCGATLEGLAPLPLPANWTGLDDTQQAFVLLNLERIARGETALLGDSVTLDGYATQGAIDNDDPDPSADVTWLGSNWYGGTDSADAVDGYLYDDGPGSYNLDCTASDSSGCWGHRDNILDESSETDLAVGLADGPNGDSTELFGYQYTDYEFSWAAELAAGYPGGLPAPAPLAVPTVTHLDADATRSVTISANDLDTVTGVYLASLHDPKTFSCTSQTTCTVGLPSALAPNTTYTVYLANSAGLSAATPACVLTTPPPTSPRLIGRTPSHARR
jgi:hypothetical protein